METPKLLRGTVWKRIVASPQTYKFHNNNEVPYHCLSCGTYPRRKKSPLLVQSSAVAIASRCGKITKCFLVNIEENGLDGDMGERNVFNATGTALGTTPVTYDPDSGSRGWSIRCETTGRVDHVKYFFGDGEVNSHYSAPFWINGDGSGSWINEFQYLADSCGDIKIEVKAFTWADGDAAPCSSTTLLLTSTKSTAPLARCHFCRECNNFLIRVPDQKTFPETLDFKLVKKGTNVLEDVVGDVVPSIYKSWDGQSVFPYTPLFEDSVIYMRSKNGCAVGPFLRCSLGSPIALDLDQNGVVERITGEFEFDLNGNGVVESLSEWFGKKEGILVDSTYPGFDDGDLNGWHLYGDLGGRYDDGFDKLALHDFNGDGKVSGEELEGIALWIDANSNAKLDDGELSTLDSYDIESLELSHDEHYISTATLGDGSPMVTRDLWLAR